MCARRYRLSGHRATRARSQQAALVETLVHRELAGFGFWRVLGEEDANLLLVVIALRGQDREVLVVLAVPALQEGLVRQVIAVLGRQRVLAVKQHLADGAPDREQVVGLLLLHARARGRRSGGLAVNHSSARVCARAREGGLARVPRQTPARARVRTLRWMPSNSKASSSTSILVLFSSRFFFRRTRTSCYRPVFYCPFGVVTPLNNPGGPEGDTVTVAEKLLNTEYPLLLQDLLQSSEQLCNRSCSNKHTQPLKSEPQHTVGKHKHKHGSNGVSTRILNGAI